MVKNLPANAGDEKVTIGSLSQEDSLKKEMATYSGIPVWEIPWTEEPGGLQTIMPQRVGYNRAGKHTIYNK